MIDVITYNNFLKINPFGPDTIQIIGNSLLFNQLGICLLPDREKRNEL